MGSKSIVTRLVFLQKTVNITKKNKIFFIKYLKSNMQHQIKFGQRSPKPIHVEKSSFARTVIHRAIPILELS